MFGIGMPEMLLILAVALIIFGPKRLPDLAKSLGRAIGEFRKATTDLKDSMTAGEDLSNVKSAFNDLNKEINTPLTSDGKKTDSIPEDVKRSQPTDATSPPEGIRDSEKNA